MDTSLQAAIFLRTLVLQACWSFEKMQNFGFLFSIEPLLQRIYPDPVELRRAALRHMEFFNTNPYMAGFIVAAVGGVEERLARLPDQEKPAMEARIAQIKKAMSTSLAAIGDSLFLGALKPACAACAIALSALLLVLGAPRPFLWGSMAYLILFNVPTTWARWRGIGLGYSFQERLTEKLAEYRWTGKARLVRRIGIGAVLAAVCMFWLYEGGPADRFLGLIILAVSFVVRKLLGSTLVAYGAWIALGSLFALLGA